MKKFTPVMIKKMKYAQDRETVFIILFIKEVDTSGTQKSTNKPWLSLLFFFGCFFACLFISLDQLRLAFCLERIQWIYNNKNSLWCSFWLLWRPLLGMLSPPLCLTFYSRFISHLACFHLLVLILLNLWTK